MKLFGLVSLAFALTLLACPARAEDDIDVRAVYNQYCMQCHGENLQGGNAQSMVDGIWMYGAGRGYIKRNIEHGITEVGMPAYEDALSDAEINALTDFILAQEEKAAPEPPSLPATYQTQDYIGGVELIADGLDVPWAIDWLDADTALITERPGTVRLWQGGALQEAPISGTPPVLAEGQGGMLDVAVDPDYAGNGWVYLAYSHASPEDERAAMTRIVRGRIADGAWTDQEVLWEADPEHYLRSRLHYGCRIVFDAEGHLYFAIGDRGMQNHAQDLSRPNGKVHRIHRDGRIPEDNPFVGNRDAVQSIYSFGNRNPQGLAVHPASDALWSTEHGPMGGDELNVIRGGVNYGWPVITYGRNYNGIPVTDIEFAEGMAQPALYWKPSIAVCGLDFVRGGEFPKWQNHLLAGALRFEEVQLLTVADDRVIHSETIVKNWGRVRDVATGPDGAIYVVLNQPGRVVRLTNAGGRTY